MEHAQIQQNSDGTQVMTINGQQLQVLQMNNSPHMIQGPNGQQIVVHTIPTTGPAIQVKYLFFFIILPSMFITLDISFNFLFAMQSDWNTSNPGSSIRTNRFFSVKQIMHAKKLVL